jgi:16S rRNA (cytosine967-C5)-methyltransferase
VDGERLARLERRAQRAGAREVTVHRAPPPPDLLCDAVLVDAPCSELGALRRGPDVRFRLSQPETEALPARQIDVLSAAAQHVRPGGRLVYATCTLRREENEDVVSAFLASHPSFALRRPEASWLTESLLRGPYLVPLPHRHGTDGFFAALLGRA